MWDPFGRSIDPALLTTQTRERYAVFARDFAKNRARSQKRAVVLTALAGTLLATILWQGWPFQVLIPVAVIALVLLLYPIIVAKQLQEAVFLDAACEKLGWSTCSGDPHQFARLLQKASPLLLSFPAAHSHTLSHQLWGSIENVPFWKGTYRYTTGSGKHQTTHTFYLYAVQLEHAATHPFGISPPYHFKGRRIRSESVEFNREFTIHFDGDHKQGGHSFFKAIPPSAMEYLLKLDDELGDFSMEVRGSTALIALTFPKNWKPEKTNFLQSPEVHPEDIARFVEHITEVPRKLSAVAALFD